MEPRLGFEPRTPSLPWKCSTTELSRHNTKMVLGEGFEPPKAEPADLQSAVFDRFTIPANGAASRNRTEDLRFTKPSL